MGKFIYELTENIKVSNAQKHEKEKFNTSRGYVVTAIDGRMKERVGMGKAKEGLDA